jgi:hypothetical protein
MKNFKNYLFILTAFLFVASCKKSNQNVTPDNPTPTTNLSADSLSPQQDSVLEANSIPNPPFTSLQGADGGLLKAWIDSVIPYWNDTLSHLRIGQMQSLTPAEQRVYLINQALSSAYALAEKKNDYDTGQYSANPPFYPAQYGIAYRRGGKPDHYKDRYAPTSGNTFHLNDKVKGLDCGGFIQLIFNTALVTQLSEFQASEFPQKFNNALPLSVYNGLEVVNKGHLSSTQMQVGDIVVWNEHIGIIAIQFVTQVPTVRLYNSHGTGYPNDLQDQRKNQGQNRGVHALAWINQADTYFPSLYNVWRIQVK